MRYLTLRNSLLFLCILLFFIAWNRGIALLYGMFALVLAILIISMLAPRFILRGISATRLHDSKANQDDTITVHLTLQNKGWLNRYLIEVVQPCPGTGNDKPVTVIVPVLKRQTTLELQVPCPQRGLHVLPKPQLRSGYPLGINTADIEIDTPDSRVLVYPTPFHVRAFPYVSASHMPITNINTVSQAGVSHEFFSVREYRHGDSPRHIHWPLTARQNELMVREHEYSAATQITLLLDMNRHNNIGQGKESTFEYAVKIAASIARHACYAGHRVQVLGYGKDNLAVLAGTGHQHYEQILTTLAQVQADGDTPYDAAIQMALRNIRDGSVLIVFDSPPPGEKHEPAYLYQHHIKPVWISFDTNSFIRPIQLKTQDSVTMYGDIPMLTIRRGDDLAGIFGLLR